MRWESFSNKAKRRRILHNVLHVKTWQLFVILLLALLVSVPLLRLNNLGMVERRTAVIKADEKGDVEATRAAIVELQHYVTHHMNTSLGKGFFLTHTYERDRDAALNQANQATNPSSAVYQQASIECRSRFQGGRESFRNDYVQCVIQKVSALSPQTDIESSLKLPKADAYRVNFSTPIWSFDLAGIFVAISVLVSLLIIGRGLFAVTLKLLLRRHYRGV